MCTTSEAAASIACDERWKIVKKFSAVKLIHHRSPHSRSIVWGKFIGLQSPSFNGSPPVRTNHHILTMRHSMMLCVHKLCSGRVRKNRAKSMGALCVYAECVEHDAALRRILCRAMLNNLMVFSSPCDLCTSKCRICVVLAMCDSLSGVVNARASHKSNFVRE